MSLPIGGFMPIPLAMMIPFMAVQSLVMGEAFGKAFQFGKRRISAMTNEEFNKLTLSELISESTTQFKMAIPSIKQSINDSTDLQNRIINEMLLILPKFLTGNKEPDPEHQKNVEDAGITQDSSQSAKWGFMVNDLITKMGAALTKDYTPYAYGSAGTNAISSEVFTPPEFGDQSPPKYDTSSDPEFVRAKNELAYRKAQADKQIAARHAALAAKTKFTPDSSADRKLGIATGGLSPLAAKALANFKSVIDVTAANLKRISLQTADYLRLAKLQLKTGQKLETSTYYIRAYLPSLKIQQAQTKKLGDLRIKIFKTYGIHY